ncbi:hypothetical protein B296_00001591 [Ensete ventricosum]|uniref:Uncharacterized protein n=1 Tax=Ensete ventricosum TaxID=4639 RepID=A0A427AT76_ENSVE|nr:hypothetical protein B296_00001591 [Ensete ventricosum]
MVRHSIACFFLDELRDVMAILIRFVWLWARELGSRVVRGQRTSYQSFVLVKPPKSKSLPLVSTSTVYPSSSLDASVKPRRSKSFDGDANRNL